MTRSVSLRGPTAAALAVVLVLLALAQTAHACVVCIPYPTKTAADHLVAGSAVVLARENPAKPFSYLAVETLAGEVGDPAIDLFLDSATRRRLSMNPDRAVVLVRERSGSDWRNLGFADADYEALVRQILSQAPAWQNHDVAARERLAFFAPLLGHANRRIHELAYLEIARAPYGAIKDFSHAWSREAIRALLRNPLYLEWYPLAILMLARNGDADDRRYVRDAFMSAARVGIETNLSAWATAYVELDKEPAVAMIEALYFRNTKRSRDELTAVVTALSVHGSDGHTDLRDRIVQSYETLLDTHPRMAAYVAKDLTTWRRWELVDELGALLEAQADSDPLNAYAIRMYLAKAASRF